MKRIILFGLVALAMLPGCRKEETVFDESPDKRMTAFLENAQSVLLDAEHGWIGTITTGSGAVFNYYMKFNADNRVFMYSDFDTTSAAVLKESGYRLKALQQPSILFDTYSYIHLPADPDGSINGGEMGQGLRSDFEFALDSVKPDYIRLVGRYNGSKATLVKATKEQSDDWANKKWLDNIQSLMSLRKIPTYFTRLSINGQNICDIRIDNRTRYINFVTYTSSGIFVDNISPYRYINGGISLDSPLVVNNQPIDGLQQMHWDEATGTVKLTVNGKAAEIGPATAPVVIDAGAFKRWRDMALNNGTLWYAPYGFMKEWNYDAFRITWTTRFYVFGYIPNQNASADRLITAYLTPAMDDVEGIYGYFVSPSVKPAGNIGFVDMTSYRQANNLNPVTAGTAPDAAAETAMIQSTAQFTDAGGYYFIQTGPRSFDMVSASDARSWVNWVLY